MSFTGHVQNGVVIFDLPTTLPDGTAVEVAVSEESASTLPSLWERMKDVVGKADGLPADAASRVDHYLMHGLPKK